MAHTPSLTRVLRQTTWTGREVAQLVLSAAEDLNGGREPVFTEAETARLRRGLPPDAWRAYVWWVEGWQLLQDHLLPTAHIALLEATRGLLAAEVPLVRLLHLTVDRRHEAGAVAAWTSLVRTLLADLQPWRLRPPALGWDPGDRKDRGARRWTPRTRGVRPRRSRSERAPVPG